MKTYFEHKGFKVQDFNDKEFANYFVTNTNRAFDTIEEAVLYCIGISEGKINESKLMAYIETFLTMIRNEKI